jgi:hypothetical protein
VWGTGFLFLKLISLARVLSVISFCVFKVSLLVLVISLFFYFSSIDFCFIIISFLKYLFWILFAVLSNSVAT